jgi:predicted DNA-binding WGR domain protein
MLKLYRRGDITRYWEAWSTASEVTIHWGTVGEKGETREIHLRDGDNPNKIIEREATQPKKEGYRKIPNSKLSKLVIQYRVNGMGEANDLEKRVKVEEVMNECLDWKGLGHCDGGDIGSGTMNVFCCVVDPKIEVPHLLEGLRLNSLIDEAIVAIGDEPAVVWPDDFTGEFSHLTGHTCDLGFVQPCN